jgi:phytanoyl-CoA hydroxylase
MPTSSSEIAGFFHEHGYCVVRDLFTPPEIDRLEDEFDRIVQQCDPVDDSGVISTRNVHQYSGLWMAAILDQRLLDQAEQLIGPDIVLNHTTLFQKQRTSAVGPFRMHQDWSYLPTRNDTMIGAMIHVSDATEEMGCLRVYPGSHKQGRIPASSANDVAFHERFPFTEATPIEAKPGDVIFFHYFTVHGSVSNRSDRPRKVVFVRMFSGTDRKEDLHKFTENIVLRGWNHHASPATTTQAVPKKE